MATEPYPDPTYDPRMGRYTTRFDTSGTDEEVIAPIVHALCAAADRDPTDLEPPLYEVIDPDGIEALVGGRGARGRDADREVGMWFEYGEFLVVVHAHGLIEVYVQPQADGSGEPVAHHAP